MLSFVKCFLYGDDIFFLLLMQWIELSWLQMWNQIYLPRIILSLHA